MLCERRDATHASCRQERRAYGNRGGRMYLPGHHGSARSHRRAALLFLAVLAALTIAMAALAPGGSFGVEAPPSVTSVSPSGGPLVGGTSVGIKGARFTGATEVRFGSAD